jgi:hypothetical protein
VSIYIINFCHGGSFIHLWCIIWEKQISLHLWSVSFLDAICLIFKISDFLWVCFKKNILGMFSKLRKWLLAPSCLSVRPSVRMEQLSPHWIDFHEIWYLSIFRNSVQNVQVLLKSDKNKGYFTWRPVYIFNHISLSSS